MIQSICFLALGCIPCPFSCFLANRGVKTLHLRMRAHEENAFKVAQFLAKSPYVTKVIYPGIYGGILFIQTLSIKKPDRDLNLMIRQLW